MAHVPRTGCLLLAGLLLAAGCLSVQAPPPLGAVRTLAQLPPDLLVPPRARLDPAAGSSWHRQGPALRTARVALSAPYRSRDLAAFYATHMPIARWFPSREPEEEDGRWRLIFGRGLDTLRVTVTPRGDDRASVLLEVNPPAREDPASQAGAGQ